MACGTALSHSVLLTFHLSFSFHENGRGRLLGFSVDVSHCWFFREVLDQETMFLVINASYRPVFLCI